METKELRQKSKDELQKLLDEKKGSLDKFRFDFSFGKNKNVKHGSILKKDIARILTILNEK
ncbi:50S ribosomal protein L29 [Candidatus Giovannonibacteria bacterium RIFCSPLOWO2_01_FULL_46_13]|uniref:Large ribosomal subunit protein uL29 n=1 Tax=Candidatus Giovannonibacteria bacterium RIFCSPLOWO2_01_FULL_46_13 TaxID=1798352 RepID=A0A1F5X5G5_9BACT|nr:MAG: 50S ribosomal protein L29 [Candidatus Giovannonibacteria bacterium RIFCSPLOWO2_01_FULL_46_13]